MTYDTDTNLLLEKIYHYEKLRIEFINQMKLEFSGCFQKFLENFPIVEAVRWPQYTPYFNDGDECIFSVHGLDIKFKDNDDFIDEYDGEREKNQSTFDDIQHFLNQIPDEVLEGVFGNHVQVTVSRDDVQIEDYDHD